MSTDSATTVTPDLLARHREYQALVGRLRDLVHRTVPPGATVVVISKGDADLVSLVGRRGWHFPQDASGGYAGYHPRESTSAIEELEALRSRGADFLVLPATSNWWLEHYADFGNHLRLNYDTLVDQPDTGIIYTLRKQSAPSVVHDGSAEKELEQHRAALLAEQIEDLVAHLVPPERPVVVAHTGDAPSLELEGRLTMHLRLPGPEIAVHARRAIFLERLESLRRQKAVCLIIPFGAFEWWDTDDVLRAHVEQRHRCITQQAHVCVIYDLEPAEEAAT
jgi:hypothetical protein